MTFEAPHIDYAGLSPVIALTVIVLATAAGLLIWQWGENQDLVEGALRLDDLAIAISLIVVTAAAFVVPLTLLAQAQNLVTLFVALELLSIPLYVLCGSAVRRAESLESGLKYLIVGSVGSATLLYGLAFIYGGSGSTDFPP